MEITDLLKCPGCHRKGTMEIYIRTKQAEAVCCVCDEIVTSRIPYPKHRVDNKGHQYQYQIPSVRPLWTHADDTLTCSQYEWEKQ